MPNHKRRTFHCLIRRTAFTDTYHKLSSPISLNLISAHWYDVCEEDTNAKGWWGPVWEFPDLHIFLIARWQHTLRPCLSSPAFMKGSLTWLQTVTNRSLIIWSATRALDTPVALWPNCLRTTLFMTHVHRHLKRDKRTRGQQWHLCVISAEEMGEIHAGHGANWSFW